MLLLLIFLLGFVHGSVFVYFILKTRIDLLKDVIEFLMDKDNV
jgi:hypothetical protein